MPLTSDISVVASRFDPASVSAQTRAFNVTVVDKLATAPKWYEVGAAKYREMRVRGETPFPLPTLLPDALDIEVPSRDAARIIPCRLIYPSARKTVEARAKCKGTYLHIHGGGWVLGDEKSSDDRLQMFADAADLAAISVGYRLAPENPFPKGPDDCVDVGEYLTKNSETQYGGPVRFIGGESAGAHLSLVVAIHLLKYHPSLTVPALLLHFGVFDLSLLPSAQVYTKPLILNRESMEQFTLAAVPSKDFKNAAVSPYYEDLTPFRGRLPKALFTCGTDDPLLDDTAAMGVKWMMAGGEAVVKIYPGAAHGFVAFELEVAVQAVDDTKTFMEDCLATE